MRSGAPFGFLAPRWKPVLTSPPATPQPASQPRGVQRDPYEGARQLQATWTAIQVLQAARTIREELVDNRTVLSRLTTGEDRSASLPTDAWVRESEKLQVFQSPNPYRAAADAYRKIRQVESRRVSPGGLIYGDNPPVAADISAALEAIETALSALEEMEGGTPTGGS